MINKKIVYILKDVYGLNKKKIISICRNKQINPNLKWNELDNNKKDILMDNLENNKKVSIKIKKNESKFIKKAMSNNSVKSHRLRNGLPIRGQRTCTNAKTSRKKLYLKNKI